MKSIAISSNLIYNEYIKSSYLNERIEQMKIYNIDLETVYPDAKVRVVPGHKDRAVIEVTNHMSVTKFYPIETEGWVMDGSMLFTGCMGFDPEEFDPKSEETRKWVEEWSYPLDIAKAIVAQINAS